MIRKMIIYLNMCPFTCSYTISDARLFFWVIIRRFEMQQTRNLYSHLQWSPFSRPFLKGPGSLYPVWVFHKHTTLAIMLILASEALQSENKKKSTDKMLILVRIEPMTSDSKSNTLLSELTWHVLLRGSLNFCSCTTWFLDFYDHWWI